MPRFFTSPTAQVVRLPSSAAGVKSSGAGSVKSPKALNTALRSMPQAMAQTRRNAACPQKPTPQRLAMAPSTKRLWAMSIMVAMTVAWAMVSGDMSGTRAAWTARAA